MAVCGNRGECVLKDSEDISQKFVCFNDTSYDFPMQSRVTAYWPDHSVKWTAHTIDASVCGDSFSVELRKEAGKKVSGIEISEQSDGIVIKTPTLTVSIPKPSESKSTCYLFEDVSVDGKTVWKQAHLKMETVEPSIVSGDEAWITHKYVSDISKVTIEDAGPVQACIKYEGTHISNKGRKLNPFVVRMYVGLSLCDIRFVHTFMYDGDEDKDFLKALGISFKAPMEGKPYNRHVKFMNEHGMFHEAIVHLTSWRPRIPGEYYKSQIEGLSVEPDEADKETFDTVLAATPLWDEYSLTQDSDSHYLIFKKLNGKHLCSIDCINGERTKGGAAFGSLHGSTITGIRDFFEKYPSGVTISNLQSDEAECDLWFWAPDAKPMDFRHYADRGYNQTCYEGYDYKGASPDGIAVTNECVITYRKEMIPSDIDVVNVTESLNAPAIYVASPEFYHEMKAFGYWSLPSYENETSTWIENQLGKAFDFYKEEISQRKWYGMFNYGDVMHTYDSIRHMWKYDVGGYAWDNTELVPTLWLWLYFLRTGREDVFTVAEKLSRHASEVDVYHFGKYKGLGSRHNVRHWGCPCKEARIAMAGHHRYLYYLTGDRRFEDIFDELKDNEMSFLNKDPLGDFFDKKDMVFPSHARSGPDWSSLVSNWMTEWERHDDVKYRDKIIVGLNDLKAAPLKLSSGPDFEFAPETVHLRYIGERTTGGTHLQICMGAPSIWMETADLLGDEEFKRMIAEHGKFYFLSHEEQLQVSGGIIGKRQSTLPMLSCAMGAYGAKYLNDADLARKSWHILLETMIQGEESAGYEPNVIKDAANNANLKEIAWVSTNFTAQWCLNAIMVPEFIRDSIPATIADVKELVKDAKSVTLHTS